MFKLLATQASTCPLMRCPFVFASVCMRVCRFVVHSAAALPAYHEVGVEEVQEVLLIHDPAPGVARILALPSHSRPGTQAHSMAQHG